MIFRLQADERGDPRSQRTAGLLVERVVVTPLCRGDALAVAFGGGGGMDGDAVVPAVAGGGTVDSAPDSVDQRALRRAAHDEHPNTPVLMITGYATVATAVEALKLGAFDYITKPFKIDELLCIINHALDYRRSIVGDAGHAPAVADVHDELGIIAASSSMVGRTG